MTVSAIVMSLVLLLIRVLLSITFFAEARYKLKDIKDFAKRDGLPVPLAYTVAGAELLAAASMLSGILSEWAGVGIMLLMIATTSMHIFRWQSPYWASKRGWEYDVLMFTLAAVIAVFGVGQFRIF